MNETDYNARLYEKMKAEQDKYRDWLVRQEPSKILNHTYEYTMREDIVMCMEDLELEPEKARALLRSPCPLSDVYKEFRDRETEHLLALVFYLHYEAPEDEQNFAMVMEMLRAGAIEDEEEPRPSPLDNLFSELEYENPEHIALKYYHSYHSGSAKTLKSIQITLAARLEKFNLESLAALTTTDELELETLGEKKTALFALIPDNDTSFNFLVSLLYTQLFQQLFYSADHIHGGSLPIPVHFLMDEFANVSLPDDFDKILSVMRSRSVSVSIILQNLAQLKALFEKQWESIVGNCDEFLYLGGNEQSTHKYVSELLGKSTIDTNTYGKSSGRSGNYSTNYQISGRELLTPDEVRMLKADILGTRFERCVSCGAPIIKKGNRKKYCEKCAQKAYKKQQAEYARRKRAESKNRC